MKTKNKKKTRIQSEKTNTQSSASTFKLRVLHGFSGSVNDWVVAAVIRLPQHQWLHVHIYLSKQWSIRALLCTHAVSAFDGLCGFGCAILAFKYPILVTMASVFSAIRPCRQEWIHPGGATNLEARLEDKLLRNRFVFRVHKQSLSDIHVHSTRHRETDRCAHDCKIMWRTKVPTKRMRNGMFKYRQTRSNTVDTILFETNHEISCDCKDDKQIDTSIPRLGTRTRSVLISFDTELSVPYIQQCVPSTLWDVPRC